MSMRLYADHVAAAAQHQRDLAAPVAAICGANPLGLACGCGQPIYLCEDIYRCTDCETPFHKACAREHFRLSIEETRLHQARALQGTVESPDTSRS